MKVKIKEEAVSLEKDSEIIVKNEKVELPELLNKRSSIRVNNKRQIKEEPAEIKEKKKVKPPPPKKRKIAKEESLEELFLPDHLDDDKDCLFRCAEEKIVCCKCHKGRKKDLMLCNGSCNKKFHKNCLNPVEEEPSTSKDEINIKYLCELCNKAVKTCQVCSEDLNKDEDSNYKCKQSKCCAEYHKKCLELLSKNSRSCLKHYCHTCYLNDRTKDGTIVTCLLCPMSYHADILCIPVATQVISRTQIICPRHQPQNSSKPVNVNLCTYCGQNGSLVLCDTCPRAFHKECMTVEIPDDDKQFKCDECAVGILPLYNSIVWAKVGYFRWWPGFVMVPWTVPLNLLSKQKNDWEFCVRFFGTYDFCYTTYDKVFTFGNAETIRKLSSKKKIDQAYNKAITEAKQVVEILEKGDKIELGKTDLNVLDDSGRFELKSSKCIYKPIQICRPVPPVKLKKTPPESCNCKESDKSPCTRKSDCINMAINVECDESCPAGKKCQNQKVRNRDNANLRIIKTKSRGFGAFCTEDIEPHTFIIEYIGELINNEELNRRMQLKKQRKEKEYYFLTIKNNLCIDAEFYSNKGRFINHSCAPNCDIRKVIVDGITRIGIYSNQFIKAGTEVTFNYQMEFGKGFGIKCNCGAASCTGVIGKFFKSKDKS